MGRKQAGHIGLGLDPLAEAQLAQELQLRVPPAFFFAQTGDEVEIPPLEKPVYST
jgi:hypothetical protein